MSSKHPKHWNGMLTKFSSLEVVKIITSDAPSDEDFIKKMWTLSFECSAFFEYFDKRDRVVVLLNHTSHTDTPMYLDCGGVTEPVAIGDKDVGFWCRVRAHPTPADMQWQTPSEDTAGKMDREQVRWNGNVVILMTFSSLAALKFVDLTISRATKHKNYI